MVRSQPMRISCQQSWARWAVAMMALALWLPHASGQCVEIPNGNFDAGLASWKPEPLVSQTGQATSQANADVVDGGRIGPPLVGQAAMLNASAYALGTQPAGANQASASITLTGTTLVGARYLTFEGVGSWELVRFGSGSGGYDVRVEVESFNGSTVSHTFAAFNPPPPLGCDIGMSILGVILSQRDSFALDVLFDGGGPTGIEIGHYATIRLTLSCSASASKACDEAEFGVTLFVDELRFCPQPSGCPDFNGDNHVGVDDLLAVISSWGACPAPPGLCPTDTNHDGTVNVDDLLAVISNWGSCA